MVECGVVEREPERVEVELTPTSAPPERRPREPSHRPSPTNVLATERSRLVVTGLVVCVLALGVGWLAGRSGGDNTSVDGAEPSTSTNGPTTTTVAPDALVTDTIAPVATTVRPTTTTSTLPPTYVRPVAVDQRLIGSGVELVGLDRTGGLLELDFDTGSLARSDLGSVNIEAQSMMVGEDWTAHFAYDQRAGLVIVDASGEQRLIVADDAWQILHEPGSDLFWQPVETSRNGVPARWEEIDLAGEATGREVSVQAGWGFGVDPSGGLVLQESGKTYRVDLDNTVSLLVDGNLLGLDEHVAVYRGCDDQLTCSIWVLDRATGDRRPLTLTDVDDTEVASLMSWGPPIQPAAIAPTGDSIAVVRFTPISTVLSLIDLATGDVTDLTTLLDQAPAVTWSADGDWVFFLDRDVPTCLVRATGETFPVADGVDGWWSAQVRPVSG